MTPDPRVLVLGGFDGWHPQHDSRPKVPCPWLGLMVGIHSMTPDRMLLVLGEAGSQILGYLKKLGTSFG